MTVTPDERDRLAKVETKVEAIERMLSEMDGKLDTVVSAATFSRGALWAALKIGGFMLVVVAALGWAWDRFKQLMGG